MCFDAERAAWPWLEKGATRLVFHVESATDLPQLLSSVRKRYGGIEFASLVSLGLALNVASDLVLIEPCLGEIEFVQFMGIATIGRQGQPFDKRVLEKVRVFKARHPEIPVQVDGGISFESAKKLVALGVSNLVIGSGILRSSDPASTAARFEELHSSYGV
jgi:ribulose-phosphate 3-epimerase